MHPETHTSIRVVKFEPDRIFFYLKVRGGTEQVSYVNQRCVVDLKPRFKHFLKLKSYSVPFVSVCHFFSLNIYQVHYRFLVLITTVKMEAEMIVAGIIL